MDFSLYGLMIAVFLFLIWFWNSLYVIKEWERGVVLRLGRMQPDAKGAGLRIVFWPIETLYRISLQHRKHSDVPSQDIITRDNVSVKVNAVAYFRVVDANPRAVPGARIISTRLRRRPKPRCAASSANLSLTRSSRSAKKANSKTPGDP